MTDRQIAQLARWLASQDRGSLNPPAASDPQQVSRETAYKGDPR